MTAAEQLIKPYSPEAVQRLTRHDLWAEYCFSLLESKPIQMAAFHRLICRTLDRVMTGEIKRLIINMPPGHGKTEFSTIQLSSRIFAVNAAARIMHLSFSDALVRKNSRRVRRAIKHPLFQAEYPNTVITADSDSQSHWETTAGGEFHAVSTKGEVTGFRAGRDGDPWDGLIILDDMMKPLDAKSPTVRKTTNELLNDTVNSRLGHDDTPIICIAQRLHQHDTTNYLLSGGVGENWHVLALPAINSGTAPKHYHEYEYAEVIPIDEIPHGAIWQERFGIGRLRNIQNSKSDIDDELPAGQVAFASQYQQDPMDPSLALFDADWLGYYVEPPELLANGFIRIDTANLDGNKNDHTAATAWASDRRFSKHLYGVDGFRIKADPMQMFEAVADWIEELKSRETQSLKFTVVRVEYANIGPALVSYLEGELPIRGVSIRIELVKGTLYRYNPKTETNEIVARSKFDRAEIALPWVQSKRLYLPAAPTRWTDGHWVTDLKNEFKTFTLSDTHPSDDYLDTAILAMCDKFHKVRPTTGYEGFSQVGGQA